MSSYTIEEVRLTEEKRRLEEERRRKEQIALNSLMEARDEAQGFIRGIYNELTEIAECIPAYEAEEIYISNEEKESVDNVCRNMKELLIIDLSGVTADEVLDKLHTAKRRLDAVRADFQRIRSGFNGKVSALKRDQEIKRTTNYIVKAEEGQLISLRDVIDVDEIRRLTAEHLEAIRI